MAEYIDREKIRISALHTIKVDGTDYIPLAIALNGINQTPVEDVVPRKEVDKYRQELGEVRFALAEANKDKQELEKENEVTENE